MRVYVRKSFSDRFWAFVDKRGGPNACWLWTGGFAGKYGYFFVQRDDPKMRGQTRKMKAHRAAWLLTNGPPPAEKPWVLHNCPKGDNPACCNPRHLWCGTRAENMADMVAKGRASHGARHPMSKLTMRTARRLRREHAAGATAIVLSRKHAIPRGTVRAILEGRTWRERDQTRVG